jgi:hypothetical protein
MTSQPRQLRELEWLKAKGGFTYAMPTWSWEEMFVAGCAFFLSLSLVVSLSQLISLPPRSHFLYPFDLTKDRLLEAVQKFGRSPGVSFKAARGPFRAQIATNDVETAKKGPLLGGEVSNHLRQMAAAGAIRPYWGLDTDAVFHIDPRDESRLLVPSAIIWPVSNWALEQFLSRVAPYGRSQAVLNSPTRHIVRHFNNIRNMPGTKPTAELTWQRAVHTFLRDMGCKPPLELKPLIHGYNKFNLSANPTVHECDTDKDFGDWLLTITEKDRPAISIRAGTISAVSTRSCSVQTSMSSASELLLSPSRSPWPSLNSIGSKRGSIP